MLEDTSAYCTVVLALEKTTFSSFALFQMKCCQHIINLQYYVY